MRPGKDIIDTMNIGNMMKITSAWNTFKKNHPKFPAFCQAVSRKGIREGSIIEITVTEAVIGIRQHIQPIYL